MIGGSIKPEMPTTAELQSRLLDHLRRAGFTENKAKRISAQFVRDLEKP